MNPRVKKIARNMLFLLSIPVIIGAFVFAQQSSRMEEYKGLSIAIHNPELSFVSEQDIIDVVEDQGIIPGQILAKDIDIHKLKEAVEQNPWVDHVNIFINAKQIIQISLLQKQPVLRVQVNDEKNSTYYLDTQANPFPLSDRYVANVPVVTTLPLGYSKKELDFKTALVHMGEFITQDSFWNAACGQIDITALDEIRIVPTIGNHSVVLGSPDMFMDKMNRLKTFYQRGIHTIDWSLYDEIDARFQGQLVCRNTKGLVLAEDPYESVADAQERIRIKASIERAEQEAIKQRELEEKQRAKERELKAQQEAKQKELEAQRAQKEAELKAKQEAKEKELEEKHQKQAEKEKLKQQHKQDAIKK